MHIVAVVAVHPARAAPPAAALPRVEALGNEHYRIGALTIDKQARNVVVPARVLHLGDAPLEYLAVAKNGIKNYESLLEADATGSELNVALILVGLDASRSSHPAFQFDRHPPHGQTVSIALRWQTQQGPREIAADEALLSDAQRRDVGTSQWVYTGSFINPPDGRFAADTSGTLIGFVHDPVSLIEHRAGLGIGAYGSVRGNAGRMPPIASAVELVITVTGQVIDTSP